MSVCSSSQSAAISSGSGTLCKHHGARIPIVSNRAIKAIRRRMSVISNRRYRSIKARQRCNFVFPRSDPSSVAKAIVSLKRIYSSVSKTSLRIRRNNLFKVRCPMALTTRGDQAAIMAMSAPSFIFKADVLSDIIVSSLSVSAISTWVLECWRSVPERLIVSR